MYEFMNVKLSYPIISKIKRNILAKNYRMARATAGTTWGSNALGRIIVREGFLTQAARFFAACKSI
jgi:hypothetical protein